MFLCFCNSYFSFIQLTAELLFFHPLFKMCHKIKESLPPTLPPSHSSFILHLLGAIELRLSDMVRPAKSSGKCTISMAKDRASPRFSIFRAKKMKGWWPLTRPKTAEDFEREEKEKEEAKKKGRKKKKKNKDKRSQLREEDIQYTDSMGNTFLLMVQKSI